MASRSPRRWPNRRTKPMRNLGWHEYPTRCWWGPAAPWKRCGLDAWIKLGGTRCLHISARGKGLLLRPEGQLLAQAGQGADPNRPVSPQEAATKAQIARKGEEEMLKQIPRVLLLVGLVSAIVVSSAPARGSDANC